MPLIRQHQKTPPPTRPSQTPAEEHSPQDRLEEATGLAHALNLQIVDQAITPIQKPSPATLYSSGKVENIAERVKDTEAELVIIDHTVTPAQQRNLEVAWSAKVLDRTGLILEIFGARARTREGRLQVELAHLVYQKGRLVRAWTHLERQRGGAAFVGGPGEAQIELDRRMLDRRIEAIKRELAQVVKTRELHRAGRRKVPYPIVALVGYTNAGKSTLFNRLTGADVAAQDQVFATLDPTMREVKLGSGRKIIVSDTVGFISDLPTMLVAAFRATLEEVIEADLILHVRDIRHPETSAQKSDVEHVLRELNINLDAAQNAALEVWNKCDLLPKKFDTDARFHREAGETSPALVSALTGAGLDDLLDRIDKHFSRDDVEITVEVTPENGKLHHWLHANAHILNETTTDDGTSTFRVRLSPRQHGKLIGQLETKHPQTPAPHDRANDPNQQNGSV